MERERMKWDQLLVIRTSEGSWVAQHLRTTNSLQISSDTRLLWYAIEINYKNKKKID